MNKTGAGTSVMPKVEHVDIDALATSCYKRSKGDAKKATELMYEMVMADSSLYKQLMDPLARQACSDLMTVIAHRSQRQLKQVGH
jgi:hypothetical protein